MNLTVVQLNIKSNNERYVDKKIQGSKTMESATDKEETRESSSNTDKADVKLTEESLSVHQK